MASSDKQEALHNSVDRMEALRTKLLAERQARMPPNESSFESASISSDEEEVLVHDDLPQTATRKTDNTHTERSFNEQRIDISENVCTLSYL